MHGQSVYKDRKTHNGKKTMKKLFEKTEETDITPNQLYLLYCIKNNIEPKNINIHLEIRALRLSGCIGPGFLIKPKGELLLEDCQSMFKAKISKKTVEVSSEFIETYRELWPNQKLPSGKYARSDKKNLLTNFTWFFSNYNYDMDTVLKATALYIDEHASKNYKYMRTSQYFIRKSDVDKAISSDLANYCQIIESGDIPSTENPFQDKVV